jgi:hypothetical protein
MVYSHIWLNLPLGDHQFSYKQKFLNKKISGKFQVHSTHLLTFPGKGTPENLPMSMAGALSHGMYLHVHPHYMPSNYYI